VNRTVRFLAYRELDDALGLTALAGERLSDARTGKNGRHALVGMLRQSVFGRLAGYEDINDAERHRHDPAMRWIVGSKAAHCCSSRNFDSRQSHQRHKASVRYASEPNSRERCASMTENSAIFNARHGAGSFHSHRQPAPTAQDCLKRGNGANWRTTRQQLSGECRYKPISPDGYNESIIPNAGAYTNTFVV
jgi:hypothetical protein